MDQIRSVATHACTVALFNTYYFARIAGSDKPDDKKLMLLMALIFPNQANFGTHINVSGAGVLKTAKQKDAAVRFLEYLASGPAQTHFASGNNEWPAVTVAKLGNRTLEAMGTFKAGTLNVALLGKNQPLTQKIVDRAGVR